MSQRDRDYYAKNAERLKIKNLEYYYRNHQASLERHQRYREANRESANRRERERYVRWRETVMKAYGARCACCGETQSAFLEIDHTTNNGAQHRREIGRSAKALVKWLIDNDFPAGFQILCANCNQGKKRNGGICPHKQ